MYRLVDESHEYLWHGNKLLVYDGAYSKHWILILAYCLKKKWFWPLTFLESSVNQKNRMDSDWQIHTGRTEYFISDKKGSILNAKFQKKYK